MNIAFFLSGIVAVVATVLALTRSHAVHALLYLIVSLLAVAIIFYVLGAPFAATLVVIVNAGAIMVLFLFVIMMLNLGPEGPPAQRRWLHPRTWTVPAFLTGILAIELIYCLSAVHSQSSTLQAINPKEVGLTLFGPYLLGVELASMLLLVGILGAYHLGRGISTLPEETD